MEQADEVQSYAYRCCVHLKVIELFADRVEYFLAQRTKREIQHMRQHAAVPVRPKVLRTVLLDVVVVQHQQYLHVNQDQNTEGGQCTANLDTANFLAGSLNKYERSKAMKIQSIPEQKQVKQLKSDMTKEIAKKNSYCDSTVPLRVRL